MRNEFTAVFAKAEKGDYGAYCPKSLANGQGGTAEGCKEHLIKDIRLMLEDRHDQEHWEPVPLHAPLPIARELKMNVSREGCYNTSLRHNPGVRYRQIVC